MSSIHHITALLLLGCLVVLCKAEATGAGTGSGTAQQEPRKSSSQDLNSFFRQSSHHPLSFSYFDATSPPAVPAPKQAEAVPRTVSAPPSPTTSDASPARSPSMNESPFRIMSGTTMDTIMQAIRDLKLTIAEMDEKLDRIVQKVAPEGKVSMMRQGTEMFKKIFHLPPSKDPSKTANERGYGGFGRGGDDTMQRGIGLSY